MRRPFGYSFAAGVVLLAASADARSPITWKKFVDEHGSSVDVPISLVRMAHSNFGLAFKSVDGGTTIDFSTITEARPGFPGNDPKGDMNLRRSDCDSWPPKYLAVKDNMAAYSCSKAKKVDHYVGKYSRSGSVSLRVQYPVNQSGLWDAVITRMAASIRQVQRTEIR